METRLAPRPERLVAEAAKQSELSVALERFESNAVRLLEVRNHLGRLRDRVLGPTPADPNKNEPRPCPSALLPRLNDLAEGSRGLIADIEQLTQDLSQL